MNIAVGGGQTGDEGKGRVVDYLVEQFGIRHVVRYNGLDNAGHTITVTPKEWAGLEKTVSIGTHVVPSGFMYDNVLLHLARGMAINFLQLDRDVEEINHRLSTGRRRIDIQPRLRIDENALLILPHHRVLDLAEDECMKKKYGVSTGSTAKGAAPVYTNETARQVISPKVFLHSFKTFHAAVGEACQRAEARLHAELGMNAESAFAQLFRMITEKERKANRYLLEAGLLDERDIDYTHFLGELGTFNVEEIAELYWQLGQKYRLNICDVGLLLEAAVRNGEPVLFEGAQGSNLDKRWGQRPNTTSSHTLLPEIPLSTGIHLAEIEKRCLAFKAYPTKVGTHHFVTEMREGEATVTLDDRTEDLVTYLKRDEFGTTTGRQRMVGWFDLVEARRYVRLNDMNVLILTKLDKFTGADALKICVAYKDPVTGETYTEMPYDNDLLRRLKPVYETFAGWTQDISECRRTGDLPPEALRYIGFIVDDLKRSARRPCTLEMISVGRERDQMIYIG